MSYDFRLCLPLEGLSPEEIVKSTPEDSGDSDPVPSKERRKRRLADALIARNPLFETFDFGFAQIAKLEKITVAEAQKRYRHVELNTPDGGNGIQIMLFDDEASVTLPYWHQGEKAREVFEEVWDYLAIIQRVGGFFTHDPQLEKILDLDSDFAAALDSYMRVSGGVATRFPREEIKRWWGFWK